ncbi:hypothetical protein BH24ACT5_BH24ACT5_15640 [soil metagenome]
MRADSLLHVLRAVSRIAADGEEAAALIVVIGSQEILASYWRYAARRTERTAARLSPGQRVTGTARVVVTPTRRSCHEGALRVSR